MNSTFSMDWLSTISDMSESSLDLPYGHLYKDDFDISAKKPKKMVKRTIVDAFDKFINLEFTETKEANQSANPKQIHVEN